MNPQKEELEDELDRLPPRDTDLLDHRREQSFALGMRPWDSPSRTLVWISGSSGRPASTGHGPSTLGHAAGRGEGSPQDELDLRVAAPQLVTGPPRNRVVNDWVQSQQDALAFSHGRTR